MSTPVLAISLGDPGGIGAEVTIKALDALGPDVRPLLVGSLDALRQHATRLGLAPDRFVAAGQGQNLSGLPDLTGCAGGVPVLDVTGGAPFDVAWGRATAEGGRVSMLAVEAAVRLCLDGRAGAMVTAPISKEAISLAGHDVPGHTEFIACLCGVAAPLMLLAADFADGRALRVGLVTVHVPLRRVAEGVTEEAILARLATLDAALRQDYGIARPRIAVLGLNPHAGDGGVLGDEEIAVIQPALDRARACRDGEPGFDVHGPFPADGFFATEFSAFDGVLAMYHDQGLAPFKALAFDAGVNVTCGLPIVRTSPDHGTAYGIAGEGRANAGSMIAACRLAERIARTRQRA